MSKERIEADETITLEETKEVLPGDKIQDISITFGDNSIVLEPEGLDVVIQFISLSDESSLVEGQNDIWTTVSRYLIHTEDKTYEVETDGPFELSLERSNIVEIFTE